MAYTPDPYDLTCEEKAELYKALLKSLYEGTFRVEYGDKKVEYRTINEMTRLRDMLKAELALCAGGTPTSKFSHAQFNKGLYPCRK